MKILYCIPHLYNSGGMERVLTQKVNWLATHTDYSITIATTESVPTGERIAYFPLDKKVDIMSFSLDFNEDFRKPLLAKWWGHMKRMRAYKVALTNYIKQHQIDLCISLGGKEIAFLHTLPCRTMVEFHFAKDQREQLLNTTHSSFFWRLLGKIRTLQLVRAVKPLSKVIVLTEADKKDWQKAGCNNVITIPNPCSLDGQKLPSQAKKENIVLAVGRLHKQKGFDLLLQAWKPIEELHPDWHLRIVGEGEERTHLEKQIKDLKLQKVVLAGNVKNMADEYTKASLFVLSSRYEGLPLVVIEALWSGLPCVAFDCPQGTKELLQNEQGWIVPNGNVEKLSEQIMYTMTHPDEALQRADKAQKYARATYSESAIMPQWVQIIEEKVS